jgi:dihydrofolate reductase
MRNVTASVSVTEVMVIVVVFGVTLGIAGTTVAKGPTVIRDFLAAGLVDHMHTVVVPILLGRGVRLWDGLEGLERDYEIEAISSPSGVTHVTLTRAGG